MPPRDLARPIINRNDVFPYLPDSLLQDTIQPLHGPDIRFGAVKNLIYLVGGHIKEPGLRIKSRRLPVHDAVAVRQYEGTARRCVLLRVPNGPTRLIKSRPPLKGI